MPAIPQTTAHTTHAPAGLGIDEGMRPELVPFGTKNLAVTNCRQHQMGCLDSRYGFSTLSNAHIDATTPTAGYKLIADNRAPVRICDGQVEAYSSKAAAWQTLGRVPECGAALTGLPSLGASGTLEDVDATNGYVAVSWLAPDSASLSTAYAAIVDQATGAVVRAPEAVTASLFISASVITPMLLGVVGNSFVAVRYGNTGTKLLAWALDTTSKTTIALGWVPFASPLCTDALAVAGTFALHSMPTQGKIAVVYVNTSGGTSQVTCKTITASAVSQTQTINTSSLTPATVGVGGFDTDTLWLVWNEDVAVNACGLDPTNITATPKASKSPFALLTLGVAPLSVYIAGSTTAGVARIWVNAYGVSSLGISGTGWIGQMGTVAGVATPTAPGGAFYPVPNTKMVRKPFFYGGRFYSAFYAADPTTTGVLSNVQSNFIICDWSENLNTIRPVANFAPGLASVGLSGLGKFVAGTTASTYYAAVDVKRSGVASGSQLATLDFADTNRWQPCAWGNSTYLSGGLPSCFDGLRVAEVGFLLRPPAPTTAQSATGITGTFRYLCVYEEVDADGNWHQSGLSSPSDPTIVANKKVTVTTSPLTITSRNISTTGTTNARSVRVAFYRTLTGGVAPYYRLGVTTNDPSATTVNFADTTDDTTLAANAKLYEQPGVLGTSQDKRPPPFFSCVTSYNGVLVGASGSDVWYSGQNVTGEGVWFSPVFQIPVPGDGDITALWVMDGSLFIAKRREIYTIAGEAPSDNGASGGLGLPRRLAVDVGCIEPRSVCVTTLGTFFQSDRGIEILTRAQTVAWIGQPFQETLALYRVVTSVTVEPVACVVYFELAASQSAGVVAGNGRTLVFDLSLKDWVSTDRRTSAAGAADAPSQSACMIYTGSAYRYAWITSAGVVHYEDPTTYLDANGSFTSPSYETAWLKHGLQQEQRVWSGTVLFQRRTAAGLQIECAYDYAPYAGGADTRTWTEAETLSRRQLEWRPKPRGAAMKFRVTATAPAVLGTGQALTFIGMSFDLAPKQGATKGVVRLDPTVRK